MQERCATERKALFEERQKSAQRLQLASRPAPAQRASSNEEEDEGDSAEDDWTSITNAGAAQRGDKRTRESSFRGEDSFRAKKEAGRVSKRSRDEKQIVLD